MNPIFCRALAAAFLLNLLPAVAVSAAAAPPLTLVEAEVLALAGDAGMAATRDQAAALRDDAIAQRALPDPELQLGIENLPLDTLRRTQDDMTMTTVGVVQRFPAPGSRAALGAQGDAQADQQQAQASQRGLRTLRAVRLAYVDLATARLRLDALRGTHALAVEQEALLRAGYAGGTGTQPAVLDAGLDSLRLADRLLEARAMAQQAHAALARWLGADADRPLPPELPLLAAGPGAVPDTHPELLRLDAGIAQAQGEVALARAAYAPEFALEGRYGQRGAQDERGHKVPDMGSVMVSVSLPLFTAGRQDRRLAAARLRLAAARHARLDGGRALAARLAGLQQRAARLAERLALYDQRLLVRAQLAVAGAQAAVAAGTAPPEQSTRAALTAQELALDRLALAAEALRAQIEIAYLEGR